MSRGANLAGGTQAEGRLLDPRGAFEKDWRGDDAREMFGTDHPQATAIRKDVASLFEEPEMIPLAREGIPERR